MGDKGTLATAQPDHLSPNPAGEESGPTVVLGGRYEVGALIGRGGMADVYQATDRVLRRNVAVKMFRAGMDSSQDNRERFVTEIHTLASLTHPHLVPIYDASRDADNPWCVMQYIENGSLADFKKPADPLTVAKIGKQIALALAYIHEMDIIHRDVKPSNVLLDDEGTAFLADFGVAQIADAANMTESGTLLGTAAYLAPEQVSGGTTTTAVDIYSLALVLLECLTGEREYSGTTVESAVARLTRPPQAPKTLSPQWQQLISAMTATDPEQRPDAAAVITMLQKICTADKAVSTPPSPVGAAAMAAPAVAAAAAAPAVGATIPAPTSPLSEVTPLTPASDRTILVAPLSKSEQLHDFSQLAMAGPIESEPIPPQQRKIRYGLGVLGAVLLIGLLIGPGRALLGTPPSLRNNGQPQADSSAPAPTSGARQGDPAFAGDPQQTGGAGGAAGAGGAQGGQPGDRQQPAAVVLPNGQKVTPTRSTNKDGVVVTVTPKVPTKPGAGVPTPPQPSGTVTPPTLSPDPNPSPSSPSSPTGSSATQSTASPTNSTNTPTDSPTATKPTRTISGKR